MISPERYEQLARVIVEASENANVAVLRSLRRAAVSLLNSPNGRDPVALALFRSELRRIVGTFSEEWKRWRAKNLPAAYIEGVKVADSEVRALDSFAMPTGASPTQAIAFAGMPAPRKGYRLPDGVRDTLRSAGLSDGLITPYQVFDAAARRAMGD